MLRCHHVTYQHIITARSLIPLTILCEQHQADAQHGRRWRARKRYSKARTQLTGAIAILSVAARFIRYRELCVARNRAWRARERARKARQGYSEAVANVQAVIVFSSVLMDGVERVRAKQDAANARAREQRKVEAAARAARQHNVPMEETASVPNCLPSQEREWRSAIEREGDPLNEILRRIETAGELHTELFTDPFMPKRPRRRRTYRHCKTTTGLLADIFRLDHPSFRHGETIDEGPRRQHQGR